MQQKVNESKTLFNKSFDKHQWEIHPSIIPFLIPIEVLCSWQWNIVAGYYGTGQPQQTEPEQCNSNCSHYFRECLQECGWSNSTKSGLRNDTFVLVGCNDSISRMTHRSNKVFMKDPHPNDDDESKHKVWHDLVPADIAKFNDHILSIQFQLFQNL